MKILLISLSILLSFSWAQAQNKTINTFYKTHKKGEGAIGLLIPGWVVQAGVNIMAGDKESRRDLKPLRPFLRRLSSMRLLAVDGAKEMPKGAVNAFVREVQEQDFTTLARIREEGTKVNILVRVKERGPKKKRKSIVKNILLVVEDEGELAVFTINGRWHMGQINKLIQKKQFRDMLASN